MAKSWLWLSLRGRRWVAAGGGLLAVAGLDLANPVAAQTAPRIIPSAASVVPAGAPAPLEAKATAPGTAPAAASGGWQWLQTLALPNPGPASLDRRGTLYVADADNNLRQFAADGRPLNTYAPAQPGHLAQLEAYNLTNTLVFYDDRQQVVLLDRFLAPIAEIRLADYLDGTVRAATLAPDNTLWLFDESALVLRQLDPQTGRLLLNTPLDLIIGRTRPDFRFLRAYQNHLYLVDRSTGIYVFDNLGNYQKKLPFAGLSWVGFAGDELYYVLDGTLHFFHLYQLAERVQALPAGAGEVRQVLLGEGFGYCLGPLGVAVYRRP